MPELPRLEVPVVRLILPLVPAKPASALLSTASPLDVALDRPDLIDIGPPMIVLELPGGGLAGCQGASEVCDKGDAPLRPIRPTPPP